MNGLAVAGVAVGGVVLLSQLGGGGTAGTATTVAMDYLRKQMPIGGVSFTVPTNNKPNDAYAAMQKAFADTYGADGQSARSGNGVLASQLYEMVNVWIGAYAAGCNHNSTTNQNFRLNEISTLTFDGGFSCDSKYCYIDDSDKTPLGKAICDASAWRTELAQSTALGGDVDGATASDVNTTMQKISAIANAMTGADVVADGARYSDQGIHLSDIPGDIASGVGSIVSKVLGSVAGGIVGSSLFWVVGLGFVGYLVLRRAA